MKKMTKIDIIHDILLDCQIKHHIPIDDKVIEWCDEISDELELGKALQAFMLLIITDSSDKIALLDANYDNDLTEEQKKIFKKKHFKELQKFVRRLI